MRDGVSHAVTFVGGLILGALLTSGLFGSYLMFGHGGAAAIRAQEEAMVARDVAAMEQHRARLEEVRSRERQNQAENKLREAEARIQELEQALSRKP